jgi:hypothetical protein
MLPFGTSPSTLSVAERVAIAHCAAMREELSSDQLSGVNATNAKRRTRGTIGHRCASTNHVDTASILDEAWTQITGSACNFKDPAQAAQFDDAYTLARDADYDPARVTKEALAA